MRKFLPLLLLLAPCAWGQAFETAVCTQINTAASLNCTLTASANTAFILTTRTSASLSSVSDTFGLSWTTMYSSAGLGQVLCAQVGSNSGSETVTVNFGASSPSNLQVVQFEGGVNCALDGSVQTASSGGNPINVNITTSSPNELAWGVAWANWTGGGGCNNLWATTGGSLNILGTGYTVIFTPSTFLWSCSPNVAGGTSAIMAFTITPTLGPFFPPMHQGNSAMCFATFQVDNPSCETGISLPYTSNVALGELLVAGATWCANPACTSIAGALVNITDTQGNSWTCTGNAGPVGYAKLCYAVANATGADTVIFTNPNVGTTIIHGTFTILSFRGGTFGPCDFFGGGICGGGGACAVGGQPNWIQTGCSGPNANFPQELIIGTVMDFNPIPCKEPSANTHWPFVDALTPAHATKVNSFGNVGFAVVSGVLGTPLVMNFDCTQPSSANVPDWAGSFLALKFVPAIGRKSQVY